MKGIVVLFAKLDIGQPQSTLHSAVQSKQGDSYTMYID